jgi:hypothetical protein
MGAAAVEELRSQIVDWPLRRAGGELHRVARGMRQSDEWRQTGHCALLVAIISALAALRDHHLSRPLMGLLVVGYTVLAGALYREGRRQRLAPAPPVRSHDAVVAGLTIALAALTLAALIGSF